MITSLGLSGAFDSYFDIERRRLVIPVEFRNLFEDTCVATLGPTRLLIYKPEEWHKRAILLKERYEEDNNVKSEVEYLDFYSNSKQLVIDRQRRIVIPQELAKKARLEREVNIIGVGDHLQVWSKRIWLVFDEKMREARERLYLENLKNEGIDLEQIL